MQVNELVQKTRSYRRFQADKPVPADILVRAVDLARQVPCSSNSQTIRYAISVDPAMNARLFPETRWAAKLKGWGGPAESERPTGYVVIGGDESYNQPMQRVDMGIACQVMAMFLTEAGLVSCMLASINTAAIHDIVGFPKEIKVVLALAVGYPGETVILEEAAPGGSLDYYRDAEDRHHVPKKRLDEVMLARFG